MSLLYWLLQLNMLLFGYFIQRAVLYSQDKLFSCITCHITIIFLFLEKLNTLETTGRTGKVLPYGLSYLLFIYNT